jgi:uncharacterized protein YbbC (DUF1343 family)
MRLYAQDFRWTEPPYEYVFDKLPMDIIMGDDTVRADLEFGCAVPKIEEKWEEDLMAFQKQRKSFLRYC